ncbi:MAG TPA: hypothetical protein VJ715_20395 [Pyrinomonadaceae bacterium]|nr:hypothetical protein [Pyrinomonadaceae bacterium]
MRTRSFATVVLRIIGLMSIIYGLMTLIFILATLSIFSGMASGPGMSGLSGMGSMIMLQFLLPTLMITLGALLIAASRALAGVLTRDLEDDESWRPSVPPPTVPPPPTQP